MPPGSTGGGGKDDPKKQQGASDSGSRPDKDADDQSSDSTDEEKLRIWRNAQIGRQDPGRDANQGERECESTGTHLSAGGGDALDVLQLAAVDDTALHRVIQ